MWRIAFAATRSRLPPLPPNVTLAMSSSGEEDIVHDLHEDNDDDEEIPYVYTSSDEEDMCTYSDDESISSDSSNADSDMYELGMNTDMCFL